MNYYLGLELKGNQLKIAAFKKVRQSFEIVKLDTLDIPADADEATRVVSFWIGQHLAEATSLKAVLTISESSLYIKELEFPKIHGEKLNEAVYWEIPSVAPIKQNEAVFDWQIISEEKDMQKVLVIVGKSNYIQNIILILRNAQIDVVAIEPSASAFARITNAPFDSTTLICLAEELGTEYIILKNGLPYFTTSTSGNISNHNNKNIKTGADLMSELVYEGKKIMGYWEKRESNSVHQVIVAGDLAYKFFGLTTALNLFPPMPTQIGTVKKVEHLNTGDYQENALVGYLISLGAGMRHMQKDVYQGVNLFPPAEKSKSEKIQTQKKQISNLMNFVYINIVVLAVISVAILASNFWWISLDRQHNSLGETVNSRETNALIDEISSTNTAIQNVTALARRQVDSGARMKTMSGLLPETLRLTQINMTGVRSEEWTIEGLGDRDSVLVYHKLLTQQSGAVEVDLAYSSFNNNTQDNQFIIIVRW